MSKFTKGYIPWNKGKRGYMGANRTSFTKEQIDILGKQSEGKPRWNGRDGLICVTQEKISIKDARTDKIYMCRKRIPYARYILQQNGVQVPKGYIVYHKDGDVYNNNINNLEVITRSELLKRNKKCYIGYKNEKE